MLAVGDDADVEVRREEEADRPGLAVVERAHRVEEVGAEPRPGVGGHGGVGPRRVRVADRHRHPAGDEPADEVDRPGKLGGERDEPDGHPLEPALDERHRRCEEPLGRVRPRPTGAQERPLEMDAEEPGALGGRGHRPGQVVQAQSVALHRRTDDAGQIRGDSRGRETGADPGDIGRRVREVVTEGAVHLEIDQAGRDRGLGPAERTRGCRGVGRDGLDRADPILVEVDDDVTSWLRRVEPAADEHQRSSTVRW